MNHHFLYPANNIFDFLPFGEEMAAQHSQTADFETRYKFNDYGGKKIKYLFVERIQRSCELDQETGLYYYGARYYNPQTSIWLSVDPLVEKYPGINPYNYVMNNPVRLRDPKGLDTLDVTRNKKGIWKITNYQKVKGNDVIRLRGEGVQATDYIFSEGEYGHRVIALNIEGNKKYTLGVFLISGKAKDDFEDGAYGFYVTPGGNSSNMNNSGKRINDGNYSIEASTDQGVSWYQPQAVSSSIRWRGIKFHPILNNAYPTAGRRPWTSGCFVIFNEYELKNGNIFVKASNSKFTSMYFNLQLGATTLYNEKGARNRPGAEFSIGFSKSLILLTK